MEEEHSKTFTNIFFRQRNRAELRAKTHAGNKVIGSCHFVEIDPKPDLPLDNILWGNPGNLSAPVTSYSCSFQDPQKVLAQQKAFRLAFDE